MKYIWLIGLCLIGVGVVQEALAQVETTKIEEEVKVTFYPNYEDNSIAANDSTDYLLVANDLKIEVLRWYVSNMTWVGETGEEMMMPNNCHLIDAADKESLSFTLPLPKNETITHLQFQLGIDSLTNVSGAFGGDLDPTNGMYWTWQSGYVNFKLEGIHPDCPARHHRFQYHIGGYQHPFQALRTVKLSVQLVRENEIVIDVAIDQWLKAINIGDNYQVMSPNEDAMRLANRLSQIFSIVK